MARGLEPDEFVFNKIISICASNKVRKDEKGNNVQQLCEVF